MKKIVSIILSIFLLLVLISTVILADAQEEIVVFSRAEGFPNRDPYQGAAANQVIDRLIYDRLVELMPDGSIAPGLAKSWELSKNEKEVTFHLHEGIKFHNGKPFTAWHSNFNISYCNSSNTWTKYSKFNSSFGLYTLGKLGSDCKGKCNAG